MQCSCRSAALTAFVKSVTGLQLLAFRTPTLAAATRQCRPSISSQVRRPNSKPLLRAFETQAPTTRYTTAGDDALGENIIFDLDQNRRPSNDDSGDATAASATTAVSQSSANRPRTLRRQERYNRTEKGQAELRTRARIASARESKPSDQASESDKEDWEVQRDALKEKFPEGWNPRKKLSPDAMTGIRALHKQFPEEYSTEVLAKRFEVSPEAIRRILRSKWEPSAEEEEKRQERWFNRGKQVWERWAQLGKKPPRRWRKEGIVRDPIWHEPREARNAILQSRADTGQSRAAAIRRRRIADNLI